jgi:hypothetical protein
MAALDYLNGCGLTVEAINGKLRLSPIELVTDDVRRYMQQHRTDVLTEITYAPQAWLHLLVLESGAVVQHFLEQTTAEVEQDAWRRHGALLLSVVPVPGIQRALTDEEIDKALAGTLAKQPTPIIDDGHWLRRVAAHLDASPEYLMKQGFLDWHDLVEQQHQLPKTVACLIRSNPAWRVPPVNH